MAEQIQVFNHIDRPYTGYSRVLETAKAVSGLGLIDIYPNGEKLSVTVNGHSLGGHLASSFARLFGNKLLRSEERRVGKECRSRWSPYH